MDLERIGSILNEIDGVVWGFPLIILLMGTGVYLSLGAKFRQFTGFSTWWKNAFGKIFSGRKSSAGAVTPFQAVCTALASSVGTGNITGVAGALAIGGPGAVFWMWISGIFGMMTKYAEVLLAVKYREKDARGDWVGGPMYYIKNGLGKNWTWLGVIFSILAAFAAFGIGNCTQVDSITTAISNIVLLSLPSVSTDLIKLITGVVTAVIVGLVLVGGIKRIGSFLEKLVPFMVVVYIAAGTVVILRNLSTIPFVIDIILKGAFTPSAAAGAAAGITIKTAVRIGIGRGLFSNEAGLGSAPMAHAAADTDSPVKQGMNGIFEVFIDTIVVCSFTALVILCGAGSSSINYGTGAGMELVIKGMESVFPHGASVIIVSLSLSLFAFTTIIGWGLYGTRCVQFVLGQKATVPYRLLFCFFIVFGGFMGLDMVWTLASVLNALMALPNLIAVLGLSRVVFEETREHFR